MTLITDTLSESMNERLNRAFAPVSEPSAQPDASVVLVTPETAERWLGKNTSNRNIRKSAVNAYARDMTAGRWVLNGEAIKFSSDGVLLDGQHRLLAVIAAKTAVRFLVVRGVSADAMVTIDTGMARRFGDVLKINGETTTTTLAAILRLIVHWNAGRYMMPSGGSVRVTHSEMADFLEANPAVRYSAQIGASESIRNVIPGSAIGLCHWLFTTIEPNDATWFIRRIADEDVEVDHPARVLRRRMIQMRITSNGRVDCATAVALTIRAWNSYRNGERPHKLQLPKGGLTNENFPRPR